MRVEDYFPQGKRWWLRLHEKGGKEEPDQRYPRHLARMAQLACAGRGSDRVQKIEPHDYWILTKGDKRLEFRRQTDRWQAGTIRGKACRRLLSEEQEFRAKQVESLSC